VSSEAKGIKPPVAAQTAVGLEEEQPEDSLLNNIDSPRARHGLTTLAVSLLDTLTNMVNRE
jgi:hypothetical protein